jgi:periplasmic copper chaperone A
MKKLAGFIAGMCFALSAFATQDVTVSGAWVRATAPGQDSAAASMNITSSRDAKLVAVAVGKDVADRAELHTMKHENGMMVMRRVDSLALPAAHAVSLGAGDHIMLIGLKHPLKPGASVPLKLTIEFAGKHKQTIDVEAEVRMSAPDHEMKGMEGMDGMHPD